MTGPVAILLTLSRLFLPPSRPRRLLDSRRMHLFAAIGAGGAAGLILLAAYYATLGLLPPASAYPSTQFPSMDLANRFDIAQFFGTLLYPPIPTELTWCLGLMTLFGTLVALGVVYAFLLAWTLQTSSLFHGVGFGAALFVGLGGLFSVANGLHPAVLRNALPDTGVFLLGWSALATVQFFIVNLLYGAVLGTLYQRFAAMRG